MNAVSRLLRFFGLACLAMVVLTHIAEKLHVLPNMGWGLPDSPGHYLADHREELLAEAAALVERWRQEGFFGKRAQCAALSNNDQPKAR
jgi:hypothetical protein